MLDYELAENMEMVLLRKSVRALAILIALLAAACTTIAPDDLMGASVAGDVSRVKTLLAAKADVNAIDEYGLGFTALMLASEKGHLEVVRALLAAGADVNAKLIRGFGIGQTALSLASLNGQPEVVRALLVAGADMNAANSYGFTAFRLASDKGHLEVIRILIAAGADVNAEDPQGYTALRSASGKGHPDVVRTLLAAGADVNAKAYGTTVLREALKNGHRDIAELLRQHGSHEYPFCRQVAHTEKSHIPSNLVVDRWTSDAESSSLLDSPFLPDVWSYTLSQNNLSNISKLKIYH